MEKLLNQLIITAGQWKNSQSNELELQFEKSLDQLQALTGKSREQVTKILLDHIEGVAV